MFRLLSRQAFKAVPKPFRLSTGTSRRISNVQVPYTGPPSYNTIDRRLSSLQVDPQEFSARKRQQEAEEFVDIHDIGGTDPKDHDVLITDIKHETLETKIAEEIGIPYLSKAAELEAKRRLQWVMVVHTA